MLGHPEGDGTEYPAGLYKTGFIALYREQGASAVQDMLVASWDYLIDVGFISVNDGVITYNSAYIENTDGSQLVGELIIPEDKGIVAIGD